jgi:hypothetical protein
MNTTDSIAQQLYASAKIKPIQRQNQIKNAKKLEDGSMEFTQNSGNGFTVSHQDMEIQAFLVYTMLNTEVRA